MASVDQTRTIPRVLLENQSSLDGVLEVSESFVTFETHQPPKMDAVPFEQIDEFRFRVVKTLDVSTQVVKSYWTSSDC